MTVTPLAKKLRLDDARRVLVWNAPEGYLSLLGELPDEIELLEEPAGSFDFAHLFAADRAELEEYVDRLLDAVEYDAILWVSYPKGGSGIKTDLNRDRLWAVMLDRGVRPVTQVSIDDVWSAMRFRPKDAVGRRR